MLLQTLGIISFGISVCSCCYWFFVVDIYTAIIIVLAIAIFIC